MRMQALFRKSSCSPNDRQRMICNEGRSLGSGAVSMTAGRQNKQIGGQATLRVCLVGRIWRRIVVYLGSREPWRLQRRQGAAMFTARGVSMPTSAALRG